MELDVGLQAVPGQHHAGLQNLSRFLDEELNLSASAANSLIQEAARQIVVAQYCEATEFGWPEWGSILTAPVIGLCGLHMLMFWATRHAYMLKLLAALFVANSLGSFYMHFGGRQGWQRVDGETMILAVWIVNAVACRTSAFAGCWSRSARTQSQKQSLFFLSARKWGVGCVRKRNVELNVRKSEEAPWDHPARVRVSGHAQLSVSHPDSLTPCARACHRRGAP